MCFFRFKLNVPCLGPVVKLDYFVLGDIVYCVYVSMCNCDRSVVCIDCSVTMGADGGGDIPSVIIPYGGS